VLRWLAEQGVDMLAAAVPLILVDVAYAGHVDVLKWGVSQFGPDCLRATDNGGSTAVIYACHGGRSRQVVALRVRNKAGDAPLQMLELYEVRQPTWRVPRPEMLARAASGDAGAPSPPAGGPARGWRLGLTG